MAIVRQTDALLRALSLMALMALASCEREPRVSAEGWEEHQESFADKLASYRTELLLDSPRNVVSRLHSWPIQQASDKSCSVDEVTSLDGQRTVVESLDAFSHDAVLRSGTSFFAFLTPSRDPSVVSAMIIRALHCLCKRAAERSDEALARAGLKGSDVMIRLLTSSDDSSTYRLAKNATNQGLACKRVLGNVAGVWQPRMDEPRHFLQRERLNALSEMIVQRQRHRAHDLRTALQVIESGFGALERGQAVPPLGARPGWWDRLWSTQQAHKEAAGRYVASIIVKSSAEHFRTVVATHDAVISMLRDQQ